MCEKESEEGGDEAGKRAGQSQGEVQVLVGGGSAAPCFSQFETPQNHLLRSKK